MESRRLSNGVYSTLDQRILGDERFVQKVSKKARKTEIRGRKRHQYTLPEIGEAVQQAYGVSLNQLREKGKNEVIQCGRKVMSLVAKDYGYKGQDIAGYLERDPAVITSHLREREKFESEVEKLHEILRTKKS